MQDHRNMKFILYLSRRAVVGDDEMMKMLRCFRNRIDRINNKVSRLNRFFIQLNEIFNAPKIWLYLF